MSMRKHHNRSVLLLVQPGVRIGDDHLYRFWLYDSTTDAIEAKN